MSIITHRLWVTIRMSDRGALDSINASINSAAFSQATYL